MAPIQGTEDHEDAMVKLPDGAPKLEEILLQTDAIPWREKSLKGDLGKDAVAERRDRRHDRADPVRQGRGHSASRTCTSSNQFMFCLQGRYEYTGTGVVLTPGSFYCNPKGHVHGPAVAHEDTVVVEIYDGPHYPQKPSWYTDERDAH